jgi:hypothetical protein
MKVFDSTLDFIALVGKEAEIKDFEPLFTLLRETREHKLLFGEEIGKFITELYKNGLKLRTTHSLRVGGKPVDTVEEANIIEWFAEQTTVAEQKFLQYIDFRQPY